MSENQLIKILIVDDDVEHTDLVYRMLREQNFEIKTAQSAEEALEVFEHFKFDLLITDYLMPGMTGTDLIREIEKSHWNCKCIVITTNTEISVAQIALQHIVADFLIKPINGDQLKISITLAIERLQMARSLKRGHEDLKLTQSKLEVFSEKLTDKCKKLEESNNYIESILVSLTDALFVVDVAGRIQNSNPICTQLFEYSSEELEKIYFIELFENNNLNTDDLDAEFENSVAWLESGFEELIQIGLVSGFRAIMRTKSGLAIPVMVSGSMMHPVLDQDIGFVCVVKDFREFDRMEAERSEKQTTMIHNDRLKFLGEMAAGVAHELNQPLQVIGLASQRLIRQLDLGNLNLEKLPKALGNIAAQTKRAKSIVDQMKSFSRSDGQNLKLLDLNHCVTAAFEMFSEKFRLESIAFTKILFPDPPKVKCDRLKLEQVLINFISNAHDAVQQKSISVSAEFQKHIEIALEVHTDSESMILSVKDNGIGMSPEFRKKCMQPFVTSKEVGSGTGLGLSISQKILSEFDAKMEIESEAEVGSIFKVVFQLQ